MRIVLVCLVVVVLVAGLLGAAAVAMVADRFSPANVRDVDTESRLASVAASLHDRYGDGKRPLPAHLALDAPLEYRNLGSGRYELCAAFERRRDGAIGTWAHALGRSCFDFAVAARPWRDPKTRPWFAFGC